ncbi:MAG: ACT domain-containing protein [Endomicrobiales bacterium]|nr:ACT domain-containing protein [Endomicrobiales bacterium]
MKRKKVAISVLGKDRPGIVSSITRVLYETGCNIEDSSMTQLRGEFAMILLVELTSKLKPQVLFGKLKRQAGRLKLSASMRILSSGEGKREKSKGKPYIISVFGADKPGIVYKVSSFLSKNRINITDVQTNISKSNNKSTYIMLLEVDLPAKLSAKTIQNRLKDIANNLKVSININPVENLEL